MMGAVSIAVAGLIAYAADFRSAWLALFTGLIALPMQAVVMFVTLRLFTLELEVRGREPSGRGAVDVRGILYADRSGEVHDPAGTVIPSPDIHFDAPRRRWTLEGAGIGILAAVITLYFAYLLLTPVIVKIFPEFGATMSGPRGFPVTVHVGSIAIAVTNGSAARWTCKASVATQRRTAYTAVFIVEPYQTHSVSYADFLQSNGHDRDRIESAARGGMELNCLEPSGITHFAQLSSTW